MIGLLSEHSPPLFRFLMLLFLSDVLFKDLHAHGYCFDVFLSWHASITIKSHLFCSGHWGAVFMPTGGTLIYFHSCSC